MSVVGKYANVGNKVWVHYNTKSGQSQSGDYTYIKGYAKNRSQKVEDGETYVKAVIDSISWHYTSIAFNLRVLDKDGTAGYRIQIKEPERLTLIVD